nr:MAG TPA: hypothetical protein [Caudoviricetes sp.]
MLNSFIRYSPSRLFVSRGGGLSLSRKKPT